MDFQNHFYRESNKMIGFVVCSEFVEFCGCQSQNIELFVSSTRRCGKGWKVVRLESKGKYKKWFGTKFVTVGKEKKSFPLLFCHVTLFEENQTTVGWVKVVETKE